MARIIMPAPADWAVLHVSQKVLQHHMNEQSRQGKKAEKQARGDEKMDDDTPIGVIILLFVLAVIISLVLSIIFYNDWTCIFKECVVIK